MSVQTIRRAPKGGWRFLDVEKCPMREQHTEGPSGYLAWHDWAERMNRTHRQLRCAGCHRYVVWVPKARAHDR